MRKNNVVPDLCSCNDCGYCDLLNTYGLRGDLI